MAVEFLPLSEKEKSKLKRRFIIVLIIASLIPIIPILYLCKDAADYHSGDEKTWALWLPLLAEAVALLALITNWKNTKIKNKEVITGIVTNKTKHIRRGKNARTRLYLVIDESETCFFPYEKSFDTIKTGMKVKLEYLGNRDEMLSFEILSTDNSSFQNSAKNGSHIPNEDKIIAGLSEDEIQLIRTERTKNIKRNLIFLILFGIIEIPILLLCIVNPEKVNLIVGLCFILPYLYFIFRIVHRFNADISANKKTQITTVVTDKFKSDRVLIDDSPEEFTKGLIYYVVSPKGQFQVSQEIFEKCSAGTALFLEFSPRSRVLLNCRLAC